MCVNYTEMRDSSMFKVMYTHLVNLASLTAIINPDEQDLVNLINASVGAASWLIVMSIIVGTAEITAIVFAIINIHPKIKLILDITVSCDQLMTS